MSSSTPETALVQNPTHITMKYRSIDAYGTPRPRPSARTLHATFEPTKNARPTVCRIRTKGNTHSEGDSRSHVLNVVASSQAKNCSIRRESYLTLTLSLIHISEPTR